MKLIHVTYCGEYGEAEGFFTENGELLEMWSLNDADWRSEYMDPLLHKLGHTVEHVSSPGDSMDFENKLREWWGYTDDAEDDSED